jgi:hypothetical protein
VSVLSGFFTGTLALAALEAVVTSPVAADRIGALGQFATVVIDRVVSPDVPAIGSTDFIPPPPFTAPDDPATPDQADATAQPAPTPKPALRSTKAPPPKPIPTPHRTP